MELADYDAYIRQDTYTGVVYFRSTDLINLLESSSFNPLRNSEDFRLSIYLADVHKSALKNMDRKVRDSTRHELARTDHEQLTSIVNGLVDVAREVAPNSAKLLVKAVRQAKALNLTAVRLWNDYKSSKSKGNVKFVSKLSVQLRTTGGTVRRRKAGG